MAKASCESKIMSAKVQGFEWAKPFVVKVQISEFTTARNAQVLVYNEDHSVYWQDAAGVEILQAMRGRPKVYFEAIRDSFGVIHLGDEVKDQDW
jgi:hypothetical protein